MPGWDVPVGMLRFYIANLADFVRRTVERRSYDPGLLDGLRVQKMVDAAARADESGTWVNLPSEQDS
jgi:predicted dehydrogenase